MEAPNKGYNGSLRFVEKNGIKYFHQEDIYLFLIEAAAVEETDVRQRFQECAKQLLK
jgi:hypothetical protein